MAISKDKIRFEISMDKKSYDLISTFANAFKMRKSEFIECCCVNHIQKVVYYQEAQRKNKKKGKA